MVRVHVVLVRLGDLGGKSFWGSVEKLQCLILAD